MSALITGITGFAGSHLAEFLLTKKEIVGGTYILENLENVERIKSRIRLWRCDLSDFSQVSQLLKNYRPTEIYHLAGFSSVGKSFDRPVETHRQNFNTSLNLLEAARRLKLNCRILMVSSSEVYGRVPASRQPIKETEPLNPISPYGVSKAVSDQLAYQYFLHYRMEIIRVRAFNHIGPRQAPGFVIPDFASQLARIAQGKQEPVIRAGNLQVKRDFTDVRDVVRGYYLLMKKGKAGQAYNLACQKAYSLKEILKLLQKISSVKVRIVANPSRRPNDIPLLLGDIAKLKKQTGWCPTIEIERTLRDTFHYWMERI